MQSHERGLTITSTNISEHYDMIADMMRMLQESEQALFSKTAPWDEVKDNYMQHVIETQEAYDGTCLVAYVDNAPAGFIFGYAEEQDHSRIEAYTGIALYVSDGYVYPAYRRQGIYKALNDALEQHYIDKGVRRITRFTLASNIPMQRFLEEEGYRPVRLLYEKWLSDDGTNSLPLELKPPTTH